MSEKQTLSDVAAICREAAGPEGTIWCGSGYPNIADIAYNLAKAGHAFFFIPLRLVKNDDCYNFLVIGNNKDDLGSLMSQNGPRQEFQNAIAELKEVTQKISELKPDRVMVETFPIVAGIPDGKIPRVHLGGSITRPKVDAYTGLETDVIPPFPSPKKVAEAPPSQRKLTVEIDEDTALLLKDITSHGAEWSKAQIGRATGTLTRMRGTIRDGSSRNATGHLTAEWSAAIDRTHHLLERFHDSIVEAENHETKEQP